MSSGGSRRVEYQPKPWQAQVSAPLCGVCNKKVYSVEEVNAAGQKFHKLCFKCGRFYIFLFSYVMFFLFYSFM